MKKRHFGSFGCARRSWFIHGVHFVGFFGVILPIFGVNCDHVWRSTLVDQKTPNSENFALFYPKFQPIFEAQISILDHLHPNLRSALQVVVKGDFGVKKRHFGSFGCAERSWFIFGANSEGQSMKFWGDFTHFWRKSRWCLEVNSC